MRLDYPAALRWGRYMPAQQYVTRFATTLRASPTVEENALRALSMTGNDVVESDWAPLAAAAFVLGASWAGETWTEEHVARATGVPEYQLVRQLAKLHEQVLDNPHDIE